jgi:hypothetical protein
VVGMLINETLFTVVESEIIEYTIPFVKEYIWSVLNTSVMRVSVCCFDLSNFVTVRVSIVAKSDTSIFVEPTFPLTLPVILPVTLPVILPVIDTFLNVAKVFAVMLSTVTNDLKSTVFWNVVCALLLVTPLILRYFALV